MPGRFTRAVALCTLLSVGAGGCGYFLHPERRGNTSGYISGTMLIGDLLWLIPGLIPGIVALAVDFSSGAIYVNGR